MADQHVHDQKHNNRTVPGDRLTFRCSNHPQSLPQSQPHQERLEDDEPREGSGLKQSSGFSFPHPQARRARAQVAYCVSAGRESADKTSAFTGAAPPQQGSLATREELCNNRGLAGGRKHQTCRPVVVAIVPAGCSARMP